MEIHGTLNNLRINDNPDTYNIQDELNAINKPTPGWARVVRAKPDDKLQVALEKARNDPEYEKEGLRIEIEELQYRITILEKRRKALRKEITKVSKQLFGQDWIPATDVLDLMTKITRKIK